MKKHPILNTEESLVPDDPALDISSLIDVCFLLLIYFLVTTTIQPREQDLQMAIPASVGVPATIPPIFLELRQGGAVVLNPGYAAEVFEADLDVRKLPHLKNRLRGLAAYGSANTPQVVLKVDDRVLQQQYIDVLNCLSSVGIDKIAMQD